MRELEIGVGSRVFERIIVATAPLSAWLILAFLLEEMIEGSLPRVLHVPSGVIHVGLLVSLFFAVGLAVAAVRRRRPSFLAAPACYSAREAVLPIVGWSVLGYLAGGLVLGMLAYAFVSRDDEHWPLLVYGFSTWIRLWFAVPIGTMLAWRRAWRASRST